MCRAPCVLPDMDGSRTTPCLFVTLGRSGFGRATRGHPPRPRCRRCEPGGWRVRLVVPVGGGRTNEGTTSVHPLTNMTRTCPDCGTAMEYDARTTTVLTGTCGGCGHELTVLQAGSMPSPEGGAPAAESAGEGATETSRSWKTASQALAGPPCQACGASLTFRSSGGSGIEATCTGCGAVSSYVPAGMAPRESPRRGAPRAERSDDSGPGFRSSNARPCRECGGPLRFSTAPDGTISGECGSCGNRFTLPPRREFDGGRGGGGGGGGRRFEQRGPPRGKFGGRGGSRPYSRPPGGGYRRREGSDDGDGDERPRRRPRRE